MEQELLGTSMLFAGMTEGELSGALSALQAEERAYAHGERILHAGDVPDRMGLVLSGSVTVESNDVWGNRTVLAHIGKLQVFAETFSFLEAGPLPVDAVANEDTSVLFLRLSRLKGHLNSGTPWAVKLSGNLLSAFAEKNLILSGRSFHTSPKTVRGRVMAYLNTVSVQERSREFDIPFDRQQLADYLGVERTALSKELGKMQKDGLIRTRRSRFVLSPDIPGKNR